MHPFREAVEARDETRMAALLADDVVFTSPVAFKPYHGKTVTAAILRAVMRVFEDFRYVREIAGGRETRSSSRRRSTASSSPAATSCTSTSRAGSTTSW